VAALGAALSAALLEKLAAQPQTVRRLRAVRHECLRLVDADATTFARVIRATRQHQRPAFRRALKAATDVPARVVLLSHQLQAEGRSTQRLTKPQFQSDVRCALALARAAGEGARALIKTNLIWLGDGAYARRIRRRLPPVSQSHVRSRH